MAENDLTRPPECQDFHVVVRATIYSNRLPMTFDHESDLDIVVQARTSKEASRMVTRAIALLANNIRTP